jgi:hypothetical protein
MERYFNGMKPTGCKLRIFERLATASTGCLLAIFFGLAQPARAEIEDNAVLSLDPGAGLAVVRTAAGDLEVVSVGEAFPGSRAIVLQVLADRVIAEEVVGDENPRRQRLWIYRADSGDRGSRVERLLLEVPQASRLAPVVTGPISPTGEIQGQGGGQ